MPEPTSPGRDWHDWHQSYDDPGSPFHRRLLIVQAQVANALDRASAKPLRVLSVCAGQGRDLIAPLARHPRRRAATGRLVEADERNVDAARAAVRAAGLESLKVVVDDASQTDAYVGATPADLVLVCGVFGNISDVDVRRTILMLPQLCAPQGTVIWTRHRYPPDLTPSIRRWFETAGFEQVTMETEPSGQFAVASERLRGPPSQLVPGRRLFTFVGFEALNAGGAS